MAAKKNAAATTTTAAAAAADASTKEVTTAPDAAVTSPDTDNAVAGDATTVVVSEATRFEQLIEKLQVVSSAAKDLIAQVRLLQKDFVKLQKDKVKAEQAALKVQSKRDRRSAKASAAADGVPAAAKRSPSGFAKPTKLSDELCSFLGIPAGTEMARTDVTRMLNNYIKQHGLQDPTDKRSIKPNADLQKILEPGDVTYFNLQAKIKRHFIKA